MSGQPYRKESDIKKFREDYMNTLALQAQLNQENLEANRNYKLTGALPPKSSINDTRTTSEILADIEGLKVKLIETMRPIFDANTASLVLQRIQSSPLNGDGSLFTFFSQRADEFVANLKRMYQFGIKGDQNDVEQFVAFLEKSFSMTKNMSSSVRGYFDSSNPLTNAISKGDIDKYNLGLQNFKNDLAGLYSSSVLDNLNYGPARVIKRIMDFINEHLQFMTSTEMDKAEAQILNESYNKGATALDESQKLILYGLYNELQTYMKGMPSINILDTLKNQLSKSMLNKDISLQTTILENILSVFPPLNEIERLKKFKEDWEEELLSKPPSAASSRSSSMASTASSQSSNSPLMIAGQKYPNVAPPPIGQPSQPKPPPKYGPHNIPPPPSTPQPTSNFGPHRIPPPPKYPPPPKTIDEELDSIYNKIYSICKTEQLSDGDANYYGEMGRASYYEYITKDKQKHIDARMMALNDIFDEIEKDHGIDIPAAKQGEGLRKRRGRPKGSGIKKPFMDQVKVDEGIQPAIKYIPFGKYFINTKKLNDDIFSIRQKSGSGILHYPARKLSPHLSGVIKTIVGGGMPSYTDIDKLSDEEKNYLHNIAKKSDINQMLAIPAPSKDKMDKEFNQFEIMKGEIMAGNDSKELIKKFKLLLLKLVNVGMLPKAQVSEIMTELLEMGY